MVVATLIDPINPKAMTESEKVLASIWKSIPAEEKALYSQN